MPSPGGNFATWELGRARTDVSQPLLSLPLRFATRLDNIPPPPPGWDPGSALRGHWRDVLAAHPGLKVGLAWEANRQNLSGQKRSAPLSALACLAEVEGVTFVSLQRNLSVESGFPILELEGDDTGLLDTAAIVAELDLVISVTTTVIHLGGALARPVSVLVPARAGWRYQRSGERMPWYPSVRLLRQEQPGDWAPLIERVAAELAARVEGRST